MMNTKSMSEAQALGFVLRHCVGPKVHKRVAEGVGLNPSVFSLYVNGKQLPRDENFEKCCKATGYSEPVVRGAMARIRQVARAGGDEARLARELDRYLASAKDERAADETPGPLQDRETQSWLEDLRRNARDQLRNAHDTMSAVEKLSSRLSVILPDRTS